jgi:hypothetical protein
MFVAIVRGRSVGIKPSLQDGAVFGRPPGTSCQATFIPSLRDKAGFRMPARITMLSVPFALPLTILAQADIFQALVKAVGLFELCDGNRVGAVPTALKQFSIHGKNFIEVGR